MKPNPMLASIVLLLALSYSAIAHAKRLVIWQKDGSKVSYELDDQPRTTFTTDELVITTATATISLLLPQIQRYTYEDVETNVRDVRKDGITISHKGDDIIVRGLAKGKTVTVYGVDGRQLLAKQSDGSGRLILSLSKVSAGVYMIKADEITYKFSKR